ncbi:Hypothetical protein NTJ_01433 [Nesidiocoris tenuis]|uniref:Uncharacterized protein n=1 Tax=Nesidiocoris tenuis TaxID=355587 RepID=A0ABN7AED1_9HEMI|nr:Hypothetical protein NTJ_01433 [Nesidiocoris tenuis]
MLTRRDNLLIRPWQERRYIQHRQKVKAALPAIDNAPPPLRVHVCYKLKKIQKENERCTQIISDNFMLLQHLSGIMSTTRIDHFWDEPPTNFLQRVGIYTSKTSTTKRPESTEVVQDEIFPPPKSRKEKCYACSPHRHRPTVMVDIRRPYTPPKQRISRKPEPEIDWETQFKSRCEEDRLEFRGKAWKTPKGLISKKRKTVSKKLPTERESDNVEDESQSVVLTRGGLSVAVKFPPNTGVIFNTNTHTRVIQKHFSECKSFPKFRNRKSRVSSGNNEKQQSSSN